MSKKLKVWLPDDWVNISDQNPDGPLTFAWDDPTAEGAFQLSTAEYSGGTEPQSSEADLIQLATGFGEKHQFGELTTRFSGKCAMGSFGTAAFVRSDALPADELSYYQVWFISNGLDFILATFIAGSPQDCEIAAAQRIAEAVDFR